MQIPLLFKIFLALLLQQAKPVLTGQGGSVFSENASAWESSVNGPCRLSLEADAHLIEQTVQYCLTTERGYELLRETSPLGGGVLRVLISFDKLTTQGYARINTLLKRNEGRITVQWNPY